MENQYKIEQYLRNELTEEERGIFENEIKNDPELASELKIYADLINGIQQAGRESLMKDFKEIEQDIQNEEIKPVTPSKRRRWLGIAAVILLLLVPALYLLLRPPAHERLYQRFHAYYESVEQGVERGNDSQSLRTSAYQAYDKKEYEKALQVFSQLEAQEPQSPRFKFYRALCHLEINQPKEAVREFNQALALPKHNYIAESYWYLALAYVRLNEYKNSKLVLEKLITMPSDFEEKANKLLKAINSYL